MQHPKDSDAEKKDSDAEKKGSDTEKKDSDIEALLKQLLTEALGRSKSNVLHDAAEKAVDEYRKITEALNGFPNKYEDEKEPRWKLPPLTPQAEPKKKSSNKISY